MGGNIPVGYGAAFCARTRRLIEQVGDVTTYYMAGPFSLVELSIVRATMTAQPAAESFIISHAALTCPLFAYT